MFDAKLLHVFTYCTITPAHSLKTTSYRCFAHNFISEYFGSKAHSHGLSMREDCGSNT